MEGSRSTRTAFAAIGAAALALSGCGGGTRQDAGEHAGNFSVDIVKADFAPKQSLAQPQTMSIAVKNTSGKRIPDLAVTVNSFNHVSQQQGLADPNRPVWVIDDGPLGGGTAYVNTWALGPMPAGATKTFTWHVTPILSGHFTIRYRVAAGLNGKAKAVLTGGGAPGGRFDVAVSNKPAPATVNPDTGAVVRG